MPILHPCPVGAPSNQQEMCPEIPFVSTDDVCHDISDGQIKFKVRKSVMTLVGAPLPAFPTCAFSVANAPSPTKLVAVASLRAGGTDVNTAPISSRSPADLSLAYEGSLCLFCLYRRRARARTRAVSLCAHAEGRPDVPLPVPRCRFHVGIWTMPYSSCHATTL